MDDLYRFHESQARDQARAVAELRAGRKVSHWMWYVFPQLGSLGRSPTARHYGIRDLDEARAYLADPVLSANLHGAAEAMLAEGAHEDAAETFQAILGEEPDNPQAWGGLVRSHLAAGNPDAADAALAQVPAAAAHAVPVEAARAQLALARQAANAGPLADLEQRVAADPANHQARLDYAAALHAGGQVEQAIDQLLESFRRDRDWNDGAAKAQLLTIFDALQPTDPLVQKGRRRLSSLIFA